MCRKNVFFFQRAVPLVSFRGPCLLCRACRALCAASFCGVVVVWCRCLGFSLGGGVCRVFGPCLFVPCVPCVVCRVVLRRRRGLVSLSGFLVGWCAVPFVPCCFWGAAVSFVPCCVLFVPCLLWLCLAVWSIVALSAAADNRGQMPKTRSPNMLPSIEVLTWPHACCFDKCPSVSTCVLLYVFPFEKP